MYLSRRKIYRFLVDRLEEKYADSPDDNTIVYYNNGFKYKYACNHPSVIGVCACIALLL